MLHVARAHGSRCCRTRAAVELVCGPRPMWCNPLSGHGGAHADAAAFERKCVRGESPGLRGLHQSNSGTRRRPGAQDEL